MEKLLKLTLNTGKPILIGVESIISVKSAVVTSTQGVKTECTEVFCRGAMAITYWVTESVDEVYNQYKTK
jgi:hypothetical protein